MASIHYLLPGEKSKKQTKQILRSTKYKVAFYIASSVALLELIYIIINKL